MQERLKYIGEALNYQLLELNDVEINLVSLIVVAVIILVTMLLVRFLKRILLKSSSGIHLDHGTRYALFQIVKYVIWVIALGASFEAIGIRLTWLIAGSAALLVGLGLGIQQIFNDVVSGILMLIEGSVKVGDVVEVDGLVCRVRDIKLRASKVITRDDIIIIIPNRRFINNNVINWSHQYEKTRFHIGFSVSFEEDIDRVRELLLEAAMEHRNVTKKPPYMPRVWFIGMSDFRFEFELLFFSGNSFRIEHTKSDLRFAIIQKFRENGIRIPVPQHDLHWKAGDSVSVLHETKPATTPPPDA